MGDKWNHIRKDFSRTVRLFSIKRFPIVNQFSNLSFYVGNKILKLQYQLFFPYRTFHHIYITIHVISINGIEFDICTVPPEIIIGCRFFKPKCHFLLFDSFSSNAICTRVFRYQTRKVGQPQIVERVLKMLICKFWHLRAFPLLMNAILIVRPLLTVSLLYHNFFLIVLKDFRQLLVFADYLYLIF